MTDPPNPPQNPSPASSAPSPSEPAARSRRELAAAVIAMLAGGGLALLANSRTWDTVTVHRPAPLGSLLVHVSGRTIVPAVTGLAVVALAGVIALVATRGRARVVMGVVLTVTGALLAWQAATGFTVVSQSHARTLVADARTGVVLETGQQVVIKTAPIWPALSLLAALLVMAGGVLVAGRGARWTALSSRYDAPRVRAAAVVDPDSETMAAETMAADPQAGDPQAADPEAVAGRRARADLALWQSLERGDDPTIDPISQRSAGTER